MHQKSEEKKKKIQTKSNGKMKNEDDYPFICHSSDHDSSNFHHPG